MRLWYFSWIRIVFIFCILRIIFWRRFKEVKYDFSIDGRFLEISEDFLKKEILVIKDNFFVCGERMVIGCFRSKGIFVFRYRVRDIIREYDFVVVFFRWIEVIIRRKYSVFGFNVLWYIDGLYKLIRWGFVVYGCIDGFLRMIIYLKCVINNKVLIVLDYFIEVIRKYGFFLRVRLDRGVENVDVARYMNVVRGFNRSSYLVGFFVYN